MGRKDKDDKNNVIVGKLGKYVRKPGIQYGKLMERLGKGGRGVVYKAVLITEGLHVAVKRVLRLQLSSEEERALQAEIDLLRNLQNQFVVSYYEVIDDPESQYVDIVMEYVEGGSLEQFIKTVANVERNLGNTETGALLQERVVASFVKQILHGLNYLHQQGVIHRDIKGANILMTKDRHIKLSDFGVSVRKRLETATDNLDVVGTPYWMAPEIISLTGLSTESDIWSLGCTIVELLTGSPPYGDLNEFSAMYRIVTDDRPPLPPDMSTSLEDFLLRCFSKDMATRSSAAELLKHRWILQNTTDASTTPFNGEGVDEFTDVEDIPAEEEPLETDRLDKFMEQYEEREEDFDEWIELDSEQVTGSNQGEGDDFQEEMIEYNAGYDPLAEIDIEDDPVAELERERVRRQKEQWEKMQKIAYRLLDEDKDARIQCCQKLRALFNAQGDQKTNFLQQPGLIPLLENLESPLSEEVLDAMLLLVNNLIDEDDSSVEEIVQVPRSISSMSRGKSMEWGRRGDGHPLGYIAEQLSMAGFIPVIVPYCDSSYERSVRLSAARFLRRMTKLNSTMQTLCACGGSLGFISLIEADLSEPETAEMTRIAIEGISDILEVGDRTFFTRRMSHVGALEKITACLRWMCEEDPDVKEYTATRFLTARVIRMFAERSDLLIKRRLSKPVVVNALVCSLDAPKTEELEPQLELFLASILDLSRDPTSHIALQDAGVIPRLVGILDHYHESYADQRSSTLVPKMMTQVISTLSNLCRVSTKRQECACAAGLVPHLQWFILHKPLLKAWSLDLYAGLAAVSEITRESLWAHDGLNFYVSLLRDTGILQMYIAKILQSLLEWLEDERDRVESGLLASTGKEGEDGSNLMRRVLHNAKSKIPGGADAALEPLLKMMQLSAPLCRWFLSKSVIMEILPFLPTAQAHVQIILLRTLQTAHSSGVLTTSLATEIGVVGVLEKLSTRNDTITVKEQASLVLRDLRVAV